MRAWLLVTPVPWPHRHSAAGGHGALCKPRLQQECTVRQKSQVLSHGPSSSLWAHACLKRKQRSRSRSAGSPGLGAFSILFASSAPAALPLLRLPPGTSRLRWKVSKTGFVPQTLRKTPDHPAPRAGKVLLWLPGASTEDLGHW